MYSLLEIATDGAGVTTVALKNPPVNALNRALLDELGAFFGGLRRDARRTRAVVLCGTGKNFAAGADIKQIASLEPGNAVEEFSRAGMRAFAEIADLDIPVIAAIRGFCLGGGNELALACHWRMADPGAKFGQPEIKLGICPGFAATQRLPRLVGRAQALRLLLTGETIGAEEAARIGLVDVVVAEGADVVTQATALATTIAGYGRCVAAQMLDLVRLGSAMPLAEACDLESRAFGGLSQTHDMREGFAAFIEKRAPAFTDS